MCKVPFLTVAGLGFLLALPPSRAAAHCDSMDGPVVKDAQAALAKGDVTLVLRWVGARDEPEIREAFERALAVRALGVEARNLADRFFLETLVRIHRRGEGAPYVGLKPAGIEIEPAIAAADNALETGSVDALAQMVASEAEQGLRQRFARAAEARKHARESVERGREYVAAYVEFMHYAERIHDDATSAGSHAEHETPPTGGHAH